MHVVMSGNSAEIDREISRQLIDTFYKRLEELLSYVGLFRINDRRTTRKEEILTRQRAARTTKVQTLRSIDRILAPFRKPDPQYLLVRQLGIRFDELTRASFPQDLIHIILTQAKEAGAKMLYFMRVKLPGWMVVIAPGGSPYTNPNVTHRAYETDCLPHRFFSTTRINTRGDRLVSRKPILGPGY